MPPCSTFRSACVDPDTRLIIELNAGLCPCSSRQYFGAPSLRSFVPSPTVSQLFSDMWAGVPEERPPAGEVVVRLQDMLAELPPDT